MSETLVRIRPFHCGTQMADWDNSNCNRCTKGYHNNVEKFVCDIDEAICVAYIDDGTVSEDIAKRMRAIEFEGHYGWMCGEVVWTEEWKAEVLRRNEKAVRA